MQNETSMVSDVARTTTQRRRPQEDEDGDMYVTAVTQTITSPTRLCLRGCALAKTTTEMAGSHATHTATHRAGERHLPGLVPVHKQNNFRVIGKCGRREIFF